MQLLCPAPGIRFCCFLRTTRYEGRPEAMIAYDLLSTYFGKTGYANDKITPVYVCTQGR